MTFPNGCSSSPQEEDSDLLESESDLSVGSSASSDSADVDQQSPITPSSAIVPWAGDQDKPPPPRYIIKKVSHTTMFPTTQRILKEVPEPPHNPLPHHRLFRADGSIDIGILKSFMASEGRLEIEDARYIIRQASILLRSEPNVLSIPAPVSISGDIHGQYYDLLQLLNVGGPVESTRYLFLGDYVDRGHFSVEVMLLLFALKITYPSSIFLLRGNHESRHLTEYFTFKLECVHKYNESLYEDFLLSFHTMPLAAIVNHQFICLHGGLSPELKTIQDIQAIHRFHEPPPSGLMCDILWSDPAADFKPADKSIHTNMNEVRGCPYHLTYHAVSEFLNRNKLLSLVRAHEAQDDGFKVLEPRANGFPSVITVFSAPNYLDSYHNRGSVLHFDGSELNVRQFNCSPHPYCLPNFSNAISWSAPFVAMKISEMLFALLKTVNDEDERLLMHQENTSFIRRRRIALRIKILSVARFLRMLYTLRNERETVTRIKYLSPDSMLPRGVLLGGKLALKQSLCDFETAAEADSPNLRRPPLPDSFEPQSKRSCMSSLDGFSIDRPVSQVSSEEDDEDDDDPNDDVK